MGKHSFANSEQLKSGSKLSLFRATLLILKMEFYFQQNSLFPFAILFVGQDQYINPTLLMSTVGLTSCTVLSCLCCLHFNVKCLFPILPTFELITYAVHLKKSCCKSLRSSQTCQNAWKDVGFFLILLKPDRIRAVV